MIFAQIGNLLESIEKYKIDGIMNAANGIGPMGAGIAGAIRTYGGVEIQKDAFKVCNELDPQEGEAYVTISGSLKKKGVKKIVHAVVMKQPGWPTSYDIISKAFESAIEKALESGITTLGCTALGTGVGHLDPEKVATIMYSVAQSYESIDFVFMDFNDLFINKLIRFQKMIEVVE